MREYRRKWFPLLLSSVIQLVLLSVAGTEGHTLHSPRVTDWGDWGHWESCSGDGIVTALSAKVESHQGNGLTGGDDTALNGIALRCNDPRDPYRLVTWVKSIEGRWGWWRDTESCPFGTYAYAFSLRSESSQGGGEEDDTGANDIQLFCRRPGEYSASGGVIWGRGAQWGSWTAPQICPHRYGLCGIQTQVESHQGSGDDTALNNVNMKCCSNSQT